MSAHQIVLKEEVFEAIKNEAIEAFNEGNTELSSIAMRMMDVEGVPMHYPYHHFIIPATLLTAACKATGKSVEDLKDMLDTAEGRAKNVLGGFCGDYGACGAGVGTGIFMSVYTGASPMTQDNWSWCNEITGISLQKISSIPGPRCCKRTGFLALKTAVPYISEKLGIELKIDEEVKCKYYEKNTECKKSLCPFFPKQA